MAFIPFDRVAAAERGWPAKSRSFNPTLRLTAGLLSYSERAGSQHPTAHETLANGQLCLSPAMPLLAHRYRYMYTLSQSDLSQLVCAIDTFQHCAPAADGRRQPLVVLKILNAQHWAIGAQEYERVRLLWREQSRHGTRAQLVRALSHCEVDAHFCIVWEMLSPLWSVMPGLPRPHAQKCPGSQLAAHAATTRGSRGACWFRANPLGPRGARSLAWTPKQGRGGGSGQAQPTSPIPVAALWLCRPRQLAAEGLQPHLQPSPSYSAAVVPGFRVRVRGSGGAASCEELRPQRMPLALLRQLAHEMLGCLLVLLQHGVLHADVKPENIMAETATMAPGGGAGSMGCGARPHFNPALALALALAPTPTPNPKPSPNQARVPASSSSTSPTP
jgi:hypothetical protein